MSDPVSESLQGAVGLSEGDVQKEVFDSFFKLSVAMARKLDKIVKAQEKYAQGDLTPEGRAQFLRSSCEWQLNYAKMIFSIPNRAANFERMRRTLQESFQPMENIQSARSRLVGALSFVTFVDLLNGLGLEIEIDQMGVDWRDDAYHGIDLAFSFNGIVCVISLKTVPYEYPEQENASAIVRIKGDGDMRNGRAWLSKADQRKMLQRLEEWRRRMETLGDHREIVPLLAIVPSSHLRFVDRNTGFLVSASGELADRQSIAAESSDDNLPVHCWYDAYEKKLREFGVII